MQDCLIKYSALVFHVAMPYFMLFMGSLFYHKKMTTEKGKQLLH